MAWTIEYSKTAKGQLRKLDKPAAKRIADYLDRRIAPQKDPRQTGKQLAGNFGDRWRYRVGDYRVICEIQDDKFVILAVTIGHRREVYR